MIFITGGTGFIGSYIIQQLVLQGRPVLALRRSTTLPFYIDKSIWNSVQWIDGDVLDVVALEEAMQQCDAVIHAAAVVSFAKSDAKQLEAVNVEGTANVVNAAVQSGTVQRFIHISSVAALGRTTKQELKDEKWEWKEDKSNTVYAQTKHRAELEVWRGMAEGLQGLILNPSTVLGFGNWHQSSSAIFKNVAKGFPWYTEGENGFVGVADVAAAAIAAMDSELTEQRFIINAENRPFRWVFNQIAAGLGVKPPHKKATPFLGEIAWRLEALKHLLGGAKPLLNAETAKVAQSKTHFNNAAFLQAFPNFKYQPLGKVIADACMQYRQAMSSGLLSL